MQVTLKYSAYKLNMFPLSMKVRLNLSFFKKFVMSLQNNIL